MRRSDGATERGRGGGCGSWGLSDVFLELEQGEEDGGDDEADDAGEDDDEHGRESRGEELEARLGAVLEGAGGLVEHLGEASGALADADDLHEERGEVPGAF